MEKRGTGQKTRDFLGVVNLIADMMRAKLSGVAYPLLAARHEVAEELVQVARGPQHRDLALWREHRGLWAGVATGGGPDHPLALIQWSPTNPNPTIQWFCPSEGSSSGGQSCCLCEEIYGVPLNTSSRRGSPKTEVCLPEGQWSEYRDPPPPAPRTWVRDHRGHTVLW